VDACGNIYVLDNVIPEGMPAVPPCFVEAAKARRSEYPGTFGSTIKFPPEGGGVFHKNVSLKGKRGSLVPEKPRGDLLTCGTGKGPAVVDNAVWIRPYASPTPGQFGVCICITPRMSLDRYGRLFVPETAARRINVLDTEGNRLCSFGRYGNPDNGGTDSLRPMEGIPLNWAYCVAASDRAIYISDLNNSQVLRVRLDYRAAEKGPVP
jgi:hypothetical protein